MQVISRVTRAGLLVTVLVALLGITEAAAQPEVRTMRRLGGVTTRFSPPVTTNAALQQMAQRNRADLAKVLELAGHGDISERVIAHMTSGNVTETTVALGTRLEWMALRRKGQPDIIRNLKWGGAKPFRAFTFTVETDTATHTFIVPEACGNLALLSTAAKAPKPAPAPPPPPPPPPTPQAAAPPPPPPPPPPPAPVAAPAPPAPVASFAANAPFVVGAFGKQRRELEFDGGLSAGYCDPILGIKGGYQFLVAPNFYIAPAAGFSINFDEGGRSAVFAEAEFNYRLQNDGFVGAGLGVWDLFDGDDITPHLLLHFGVPISHYSADRAKMLFVGEGRLFFDEFSEPDNNYQFWFGVKYIFR